MREINLQRWDMAKRRSSRRDLRPELNTNISRIATNIPDPRAERRFAMGQRVEWNDGGPIRFGTVVDFIPNAPCEVRVRLDDGRLVDLPSFANSLRHASTPIPGVETTYLPSIPGIDTSVSETVDRMPFEGSRTPTDEGRTVVRDSGFYESVEIETSEDSEEMTVPEQTSRLTRRGR